MRRLTPALAIPLVIACGDDPVGPLDCPELDVFTTSAILAVTTRFLDAGTSTTGGGFGGVAAPGTLRIDGFLAPGLVQVEGTCTFRTRQVAPDTLEVMGFKLRPDVSISDQPRYELEQTHASSAFDTLSFTVGAVPSVEGLEPILPAVDWHGIARVGPDSIVLGTGEDLLIEIDTPESLGTDTPSDIERWTLELLGDTSSIQLTASGIPPDTLVFPAALFPATSTGRLIVQLSYERFASPSFLGSPTQPFYRVSFFLEVLLRWDVQIDSSSGATGEPAPVPGTSPPEN